LGSDGIDILGGGAGDRDGFENVTVGGKGGAGFGAFEIGAAARYIHHDIAFDGTDPVTFTRADTAETSIAETWAARGWAGYGLDGERPWSGRLEIQHLDSGNRNRNAGIRTNRSFGRRTRFGGQAAHRFAIGQADHALIAGVEREEEDFGSRDLQFGGASDRDLSRGRTALVGEWRARWGERLVTDLSLRHDDFNRFRDDTSLRASALLQLGSGFALLAGYGEGIAQPSFVDLFGFGPGSGFIGNPDLRPERSQGFEGGLRWRSERGSFEAIAFSNDLEDEIVEDFSPFPNYTVVNAPGKSRRRGLELSGEWRPTATLQVGANYSFVDTREPDTADADALREIRRPRHTANAFAAWRSGPFSGGASLAYVGRRADRDFDLFPAPRVTLDDYLLGAARIGWRVLPRIELFARVENAFDAAYQDVVGYKTPGRGAYAGVRIDLGD
jgi:vitamin B12 transporter